MPPLPGNAPDTRTAPGAAPVPHVFALGAGGTGMLPLCLVLRGLGWNVTAEDDAFSDEALQWLKSAGVTIASGGLIPDDVSLVVHSSAIAPQHPRHREATARGLALIRRGHLLARIAEGRRLLAVCGSHGKTTTTALLCSLLRAGGWGGGHLLGGLFSSGALPPGAAPLRSEDGAEWLLAEVDESDGTIEALCPEVTVCTNMDWDHRDHYATESDFEGAFERLFERTRGPVLISSECSASARVAARLRRGKVFTFGPGGDFRLEGWHEENGVLRLSFAGAFHASVANVRAGGFFNALNATAACAAAQLSRQPHALAALAEYPGVRRRQSVLIDDARCTILEDYAHHPTEIRSLLRLLRQRAKGRLLVVFQPHRFSRTAGFRSAFAEALSSADRICLLEVYPAGEAPVAGGTSADVLRELLQLGRTAHLLPGVAEAPAALAPLIEPGDFVAFVGAGDIDQAARGLVRLLETKGVPAVGSAAPLGWAELKGILHPETRTSLAEPLAEKTTMGVGGPAEFYAEPARVEDLRALLRASAGRGLPWMLLGRGSNLVVADSGVRGLVIRLTHPSWSGFQPLPDGTVRVGAGLRLKQLCGLAASAGLGGFEFLEGIPGTVGGATRMNAGAMGGWMLDRVAQLRILDAAGEIRTLSRDAIRAGYRSCESVEGAIVLDAVLQPSGDGPPEKIRERIRSYQEHRRETQPREPSAGCIFRNPPGDHAGRIIDELGLKGLRVGGAEVSPVHANFIINRGDATATDVIRLVRLVRERVRAERGLTLEPEVMLCGSDWKEELP